VLIVDPNMDTVYSWANNLQITKLPTSIDPCKLATLLNEIDENIMKPIDNNYSGIFLKDLPAHEKHGRIKNILEIGKKYFPNLSDNELLSILLRLWVGCISASKLIADSTMDGPNTLETRKYFFETKIDPICEVDKIYRAGVEIAPLFKKYRSQNVYYLGIPETSSVRKYQNHEC
jgi:hypothetical protein